MPGRVAEWATVLARATGRTPVEGGMRIEFADGVDFGELGRLVGAEQHCCAFFSFTLSVDASGTALEVCAPALATTMVTDLFGAPQ
jgi:hypothetical protein